MIGRFIKDYDNPLSGITVDLGVDKPLWMYVKEAIQDIEILNVLGLYPIEDSTATPFIHVCNWKWRPHPRSEEIQHRRRETGDKLITKSIGDVRVGILEFDIYCGARDKNKNIEQHVVHNIIYIPIEDDNGRYLLDNIQYSEYQLVDKLLYPSGKDSITLKSLLPIVIKYEETTEQAINGRMITAKVGMVKIFKTMEPIMTCFMHVPSPLVYLGVYPILQWCDRVYDDQDEYLYFQPIPDVDIYVKAHLEGLDKFEYVRSILVMSISMIKKYKPENLEQLTNPKWWIYQLSYYENAVEHRGACHEMYVARMLDTISACVLPIPECDKRNMTSLLRYVLQTEFVGVNIYSFENKRLRHNEVISTIVTEEVSGKLKKMFTFGTQLKMTDMLSHLKFNPGLILRKINRLGTVHVTDFSNDLDYPQGLRFTRKGPNSLGRVDKHKVGFAHRQMHPSMIGVIDCLDSSKDVGQSGMISPWADVSALSDSDVNKYPNMKYELFDFIRTHFPSSMSFKCNNIQEYNAILDKLTTFSRIDLNFYVFAGDGKDED